MSTNGTVSFSYKLLEPQDIISTRTNETIKTAVSVDKNFVIDVSKDYDAEFMKNVINPYAMSVTPWVFSYNYGDENKFLNTLVKCLENFYKITTGDFSNSKVFIQCRVGIDTFPNIAMPELVINGIRTKIPTQFGIMYGDAAAIKARQSLIIGVEPTSLF
jgi:hypothetical protein